MKQITYIIFLLCSIVIAQNERVQIKGNLSSTVEGPLLGITVFNNNSLEGTITNDKGVFFIDARAGDEISFDAIQFKAFSITVTDEIMNDKSVTLRLQEDVKQLEVVNISGKSFMIPVERLVEVDAKLDEVSTDNINTRAVDRMENTFSERIRQPEEYAIEHMAAAQSAPRFNVFGPTTTLNMSNINQALHPAKFSADNEVPEEDDPLVLLKNKYEKQYLLDLLELKESQLVEFLYYAKDLGLSKSLVTSENELDLLEFLKKASTSFKNRKR